MLAHDGTRSFLSCKGILIRSYVPHLEDIAQASKAVLTQLRARVSGYWLPANKKQLIPTFASYPFRYREEEACIHTTISSQKKSSCPQRK